MMQTSIGGAMSFGIFGGRGRAGGGDVVLIANRSSMVDLQKVDKMGFGIDTYTLLSPLIKRRRV
jgi:hypothetical protein